MGEGTASAEISILRDHIKDQVSGFYHSLNDHAQRDDQRFGELREDLKEVRDEQRDQRQNIQDLNRKIATYGGVALVVIPLLTELVNVWFGPHASGK